MADPVQITEKIMRDRLLRIFSPFKDLIAFNLCGLGSYVHEMDFLRVLPSGWAYEFEIKVTASDIRAEANKKAHKHVELEKGTRKTLSVFHPSFEAEERAKHVEMRPNQLTVAYLVQESNYSPQLCARFAHPIKEFWVVVPTPELGQLAVDLLPSWAGVAVLAVASSSWPGDKVQRPATRLTCARKVTPQERHVILERTVARYWQVYLGLGGFGRGTSTMPKGGIPDA